MNASDAIKNYIKSKEGLHRVREDGLIAAYLCPAKVWTIGWGTTKYRSGKSVEDGDVITPEQAQEYFEWDLSWFAEAVERLVQVPLTQQQFDALVSFVYNVGAGSLEKSTLLKKLNKRDYDGAAKQFLRWDKARNNKTGKMESLAGLTKRRQDEKRMFESCSVHQKRHDPDPNNTPLPNKSLPLPTVMRDDMEAQPQTNPIKPVAVGGAGVVGVAALEWSEWIVPIIHALSSVDWRVACALIGVALLVGVVYLLMRKDRL